MLKTCEYLACVRTYDSRDEPAPLGPVSGGRGWKACRGVRAWGSLGAKPGCCCGGDNGRGAEAVGGARAMYSMVALMTVSRASRYFFTPGVRSAMTKRAEEQARRSLETVNAQREGGGRGSSWVALGIGVHDIDVSRRGKSFSRIDGSFRKKNLPHCHACYE